MVIYEQTHLLGKAPAGHDRFRVSHIAPGAHSFAQETSAKVRISLIHHIRRWLVDEPLVLLPYLVRQG
jgi:hypothetical protein